MAKRKGRLFIISAPSGCGKTTLCKGLIKRVPSLARSISLTTRAPRKTERKGRDYFFVTRKEFEGHKRKRNLLEWATNFGDYYGTPKDRVLKLLARGIDVILAIDVKGAMKVKRLCPKAILIFILPPSMPELKRRLRKRKTDSAAKITRRMKVAKRELTYLPRYTYSVVNDDLKRATGRLEAIVRAERRRIK